MIAAGRALSAAAALCLAATAATACSGPSGHRFCGIAADATSFAENTDVPKKIHDTVPRFLTGCDTVAITVITGSVQQSDCRRAPIPLTPTAEDNPNDNPKTAERISLARRAFAVKTLNDLVSCARAERSTRNGSDVVGALLDIAQKTRGLEPPPRILLISDMAQRAPELNLYTADISTEEARKSIISSLSDRMPRLEGAEIQILGFGVGVKSDHVRQQQFRDFWELLFRESGSLPPAYL
ncbi:hypothetical protein [Microbispora rosea]|uniref:hypothetical protein n=1 Tax=Microbispora rosea TaxID=58117 RepID=UPI0004C3C2CC|nr:hypothetical protein [Microbispora rosea]